jgi:sterol-4alpha-carboxylate 3-dehydrogenase (decarboxylating)
MKNILVIGGNGFVGRALLLGLLEAGYGTVASFDLVPANVAGIKDVVGDLTNLEHIVAACVGVDTVFQTAALVDWGPGGRDRLFAVNVVGNRNVLQACTTQGVRRLVYTSSIDVVFEGRAIAQGDEGLPIPKRHLDDYGQTKALAEAEVLAAHSTQLQTCALRACGIYGPGDRHRFPPILKAARSGKMVYLGSGKARFNHVYVDNLIEAHLKAAQSLATGGAAGGHAYFITDHAPGNFYEFFTPYLEALGLPVPKLRIPTAVASVVAWAMETMARWGWATGTPLLTRYVVLSTCRDFWFSGELARRELGYRPKVSADEARDRTLAWLKTST